MKRIIRDKSRYFREEAYNALTDIDPERLKLLAAIAIEYTSLEVMVDLALRDLLRLDWDETDVVSRINGFEGKVAIIKATSQASATLKGEPATLVADTLGEIGVLKTYRDAVAHADIHEPKAEIVRTSTKHGKPYEVDISISTLTVLFNRVMALQVEMTHAFRVLSHHFDHDDLEMGKYSDASEVISGRPFQEHLAQLRDYQSSRRLLPAIPKLPEEP